MKWNRPLRATKAQQMQADKQLGNVYSIRDAEAACGWGAGTLRIHQERGAKSLELTGHEVGLSFDGMPDVMRGYLAGLIQGCRVQSAKHKKQSTLFEK